MICLELPGPCCEAQAEEGLAAGLPGCVLMPARSCAAAVLGYR